MPNFSSLARLEVPEKFLWVGGGWVGWGLQSHFSVKPNRCVVLCWGWGFDNNNERACYRDKYKMSVNWYRQIWMTDMANRSRKDYNIYTDQQWQEGWAQMLVPGIYERGLFGDLMLPGIACGMKKILLIFNTNLNTPHDQS